MSIRLKLMLSAAGYALVCLYCLTQHDHTAAAARPRHVRAVGTLVASRAAPPAPSISVAPSIPVAPAAPPAPMSVTVPSADVPPAGLAADALPEEPASLETQAALQAAIDRVMEGRSIAFVAQSDVLDPQSHRLLDAIASLLQRAPTARVEVMGHTDNLGNEVANRDMSARRAASATRYLTSHGVAHRRFRVMGVGSERPVADNATPEGRALNRRVTFRVLRGGM